MGIQSWAEATGHKGRWPLHFDCRPEALVYAGNNGLTRTLVGHLWAVGPFRLCPPPSSSINRTGVAHGGQLKRISR